MSTETRSRVQAGFVAVLVALVSFLLSYRIFLRGFIYYWERQHDGRPMKFIFWAEERALPSALLVALTFAIAAFMRFQNRAAK